jgi:hypothetical protein
MKYPQKFHALPRLAAREVGRPKFRHSNPLVGGRLYIFDQGIYDVYIIAPNTAATQQVLFTIAQGGAYTPPGGNALNKTALHTLLTQPGQLSAPQKEVVRAISITLRGDITPHDALLFLAQTQLSFTIDRMTFLQCICQKIGGAGGPFSGAAAGLVSNGIPEAKNYTLLHESGETIEQQQNFSVTLDPTLFKDGISADGAYTTDAVTTSPAGTGLFAYLTLEGQLARAVQ